MQCFLCASFVSLSLLKQAIRAKNRSIGVGGGVNRSQKRWGTHSLSSKKNKKNRKLLIFTVRCETQCVVGPWLNN